MITHAIGPVRRLPIPHHKYEKNGPPLKESGPWFRVSVARALHAAGGKLVGATGFEPVTPAV